MLEQYRNRSLVWLLVIGCLALVPMNVFAAAVGQIKGSITDDKGEPVFGASVAVVGTTRGAMTDVDGKYTIPQLEPGTYSVRISHLDFHTVEVTDVVVKTDLTNEVNHQLVYKVTDLDERIVVRDEVDIIRPYETSSQHTFTEDQIRIQPVRTADDMLQQVPGVVTTTSGDVFIRGGRPDEIKYIVDGVTIGDPLGGLGQAGANLSLVAGSIQEFTVIKDGFDPEYGDAVSGIVKATTQTGSADNTRLNLQFITDDFGNRDLNKYSRNNDYVRFSVSGPDPILKNKVLPALGMNFLEGKELTYYLYGDVDKSDGFVQYEAWDTPETRRRTRDFSFLGFDVPERRINRYFWMGNIKFRPRQDLKLIFSYKASETRRTVFWWAYRYTAATAPVEVVKWSSASLEVSQSIAKNMNYEAVFSYTEYGLTHKPGDPDRPGKGLDPDDFRFSSEWERYDDLNGNGVYDPPEPIFNIYPDTMSYGTGFVGPAYTFGEWNVSGRVFRFNQNYMLDSLEGEAYIDLNGNGRWDSGDRLHDKNGNGILDDGRISPINTGKAEPYIDGDSIIGERFTDVNLNGVFDLGVDLFNRLEDDVNRNGFYDGPCDTCRWSQGVPFEDRNGNGIYDARNYRYDPGEPFVDVNGNGKWDAGGASTFLNYHNYHDTVTWHTRNTETATAEFKLFWQLGNHELKGGFALKRYDFFYQEIQCPYEPYTGRDDGGPYPTRGSFRDMFAYRPYGGYVYLRDKLEYGSMIASLGFRWDFFVQDREQLIPVAKNDDLGGNIIFGDRQKFSPRIGFSYPISDKAKVHFNYGHFFQLPQFRWMYARNTVSVNQGVVVGNYNLDYIKTVQYSFGVKYAMTENYSLDVSGYFKDEFDKINRAQVRIGGLEGQQYENSDYGRSRGLELTLEKRGGGYVNGFVSYTYAFAFGKESQTNERYMEDFERGREPLSESALDHDVRHRLTSSVQLFVPKTVKPRLFGLPIPNGWSMAIKTEIQSGMPFTPDPLYPGIDRELGEDIQRNSLRKPSIVNFDVRFTKSFDFVSIDWDFIIWVENIFDNKNVDYVYAATGRPDTRQNDNQVIKGGTDYDANPANWDYGRQIRVGLEMSL